MQVSAVRSILYQIEITNEIINITPRQKPTNIQCGIEITFPPKCFETLEAFKLDTNNELNPNKTRERIKMFT